MVSNLLEPIDEFWHKNIGFAVGGISGMSLIVDAEKGDPVEILCMPNDEPELGWTVSLLQSNRNDHVTITGRNFLWMHQIYMLLELLGYDFSGK